MPPALRSVSLRSQAKASSNPQDSKPLALNSEKNATLKEKIEAGRQIKAATKKKSNKRIKYQKASFDIRAKLVQMVDIEGYSIRQAAKKLTLKYSTAKCIYKLFVDESRLGTTHVSKDTLRKNDSETEDRDSDDQSKDSDRESIPAASKKVKKDDYVLAQNEVKQEELQEVKQEFDDWSESQNKDKISTPVVRENSIQADATQGDNSEATTPVLQTRNVGNVGGRALFSDSLPMNYLPQMHPNFVFLLPVQLPGTMLGKLGEGERKPVGFVPQNQAFNFLNCQMPPNYFLNNAAMTGLMTRFNFGSQLRFGAANNS